MRVEIEGAPRALEQSLMALFFGGGECVFRVIRIVVS
jgi:hypothetical protein